MNETEITDKRVRRYIRITDAESWKLIDEISKDEQYKSFNKVINDALFYGLPMLAAQLSGKAKLPEEERESPQERNNGTRERFYAQVVRLMKEIVLNVTINKSILSSLFNFKETERTVSKATIEKLKQGVFSDTPDYLADYELNGIKELRK